MPLFFKLKRLQTHTKKIDKWTIIHRFCALLLREDTPLAYNHLLRRGYQEFWTRSQIEEDRSSSSAGTSRSTPPFSHHLRRDWVDNSAHGSDTWNASYPQIPRSIVRLKHIRDVNRNACRVIPKTKITTKK